MKNTELEQLINEKLNSAAISDYAPNGLQVEGKETVQKIVTGVTASQALLDEAVRLGADAVIVHHGYFWKGESPVIRGMKRNRLKTLLANDINLYGWHLPLDAHPELGNNAQLAALLGITVMGEIEPLVPWGELTMPVPGLELASWIEARLGRKPLWCGDTGPEVVQRVAWCTGGAFYSLVINFQIPHLHQQVLKAAPIVAQPTPMDAVFKFDPLSAGGTAIFIAAIISIFILGVGIKKGIGVFAETLISLKWPILSIGMVLAFAFVTNYSGMSTTLALVLAGTGVMFPFFSPFLGWLGVFLTGSDTSSNALFGSLQSTTAQQINVSDTLLVAANTSGGVTGKMISPQSIAVACAATGMVGRESELFRYTVKHSLIFASVIGVITLLQAYVFTGMLVS